MTLFSRKENGFGRAAAFLLVTQIGVLAIRTVVEIKIVWLSAEVIRNGLMPLVIGQVLNLCVKSMLENTSTGLFLFITFNVAQDIDE